MDRVTSRKESTVPIITISRGSYWRGKAVAEQLAKELDYECLSRDVLIETSSQFNVPEVRLVRALHDAPSLLDRFSRGRERYMAFFRAALLNHLKKGNIVYHGLAGQYFLKEISHVLKVRIIADMGERIHDEMKREGISADEAQYTLKKDDDERRHWGRQLWGVDPWDANLYDMVLHIDHLSVTDAVDLIKTAIQKPNFQPTAQSQRQLSDLATAANVQAALIEHWDASVTAKDGYVHASIKAPLNLKDKITPKAEGLARQVEGVRQIDISFLPY
jgi:hypothetical protein